jgi:hypothetical protein
MKALGQYDEFLGVDWRWLSMDGAMTKAPLGAEKNGAKPYRSGQDRNQAQVADRRQRRPPDRSPSTERTATTSSSRVRRSTTSSSTRHAPQGLCLDEGYDYDVVRELVDEFTAHIRSRGEEARALRKRAGMKARRWVVEHTHSWMNRFRRILVRWEKRADTYVAMLHFACAYWDRLLAGRFFRCHDRLAVGLRVFLI